MIRMKVGPILNWVYARRQLGAGTRTRRNQKMGPVSEEGVDRRASIEQLDDVGISNTIADENY